jgi:hypothetical protein
MPAHVDKYPGCTGTYMYMPALLNSIPGIPAYLYHTRDTLIFRPDPSLVNWHKVNHSPCIFLVS